jgi:ankyrin repeat protein
MQIAARNGSIPMLHLLHAHGGSLFTRGLRGDTLFHLAGYNGHIDTMKWLHKKGILPEAVDLMGQTVIHVAARRGEFLVLKYLYEELNMAGFDQEDFDGRTPLDCIPRRGPDELQQCRDYLTMIYNIMNSSSSDKE